MANQAVADDNGKTGAGVRVALVDGQRMFREAVRALIAAEPDMEVSGEAGTGRAGLDLLSQAEVDVALVGAVLPDMSAAEFARQQRGRDPRVRILVLSSQSDPKSVHDVLKAGGDGYVTTAAGLDELLRGIRALHAGHAFLSPEVARAAMQGADNSVTGNPSARLGPRECAVLKLITEGEPSRAIASKLSISVSTVEAHRRNIMRKLGLHSIAALTRYAIREGLTPL